MILRYFLILVIFIAPLANAARDKEMIQSARCAGYFHHFETKFQIPQDTLYSISLQETGKIHNNKKIKIVWPWTVNIDGKGYYFDTKREAMLFVRDQMKDGKESIDVGCMQVNLKHHPDAFRSLNQAFDPKMNIEYGAKFLASKYEQLGNWSKAVAHYHSATPHLGKKYKDNIVKIAQNIDHYKSAFNGNSQSKITPPIFQQKFKTPIVNKDRKYRSNMMLYFNKKGA